MRNVLYAILLLLPSLAGCALTGDKARCGFHFELLKPPSFNTEGAVLIQSGGPALAAHPLGTLTGPLIEGSGRIAPVVPVPVAPIPLPMPKSSGFIGDCIPSAYPPRLTAEEWISLQDKVKSKSLPNIQ